MSVVIDGASTPVDETGARPVAPGFEVSAGRRGRTTMAVGAIEAIVGHVAVETPGVSAARLTGVRGWFAGDRPDRADANVAQHDDGLHIALDLAVTYPEPIRDVIALVRHRVVDHVRERLDLPVARVDVTVTELRPQPQTRVAVQRRVS